MAHNSVSHAITPEVEVVLMCSHCTPFFLLYVSACGVLVCVYIRVAAHM